MEWTQEQSQAIYENGSNILVAAAAGSGKTAVLVERIINKIINEDVDIDKLLVVTFTNAAASEMRERILTAIYKKIEETDSLKEIDKLQRQITLISKASICTIDSFCLDVIKNNFYEIGISPNFRIADTAEIELLKQEVLEELFEDKYEEEDKDFVNLIHTYTTYKDDTTLKEIILKIYNQIQSNPFPRQWINEKIEKFNITDLKQDFSQSDWGNIILKDIEEEVIDCQKILQKELKELKKYQELTKYYQTIANDIDQLEILKTNLNCWDKSYIINQNLEFITWPRDSKLTIEEKEIAKNIRDSVKKKLKKKTDKYLVFTSEEANQDIYDMYEKLKSLKELIFEFEQRLIKVKEEKNILDFNDIEHFALNILVKQQNGQIEQTDIAKKYQQKFIEIAVDEYQDSNLIQEYILKAISNKHNMFMVGDVKQSIYKFRQARPDLFYDKYNTYKLKSIKRENDDLKIQLFKNFRSRKNILDFTNILFDNLMAEDPWEIEYNKEEYLNLGADYKENNQNLKIEINVIDTQDENIDKSDEYREELEEDNTEEHIEDIELEAKYVAKKIKDIIQNKYQIYDIKKQQFRNVKYKDIAILLRSTKTDAQIYEKELSKQDIPVFSDSSNEYLETIEIQTVMSLLKIIDNPFQDIPLITVLRSSIAGFTDNDLIEIRLNDQQDYFYNAMLKAKINVEETLKIKINTFIDNIEKWREAKEYMALDELIWKIYIETGYYNYVGLMQNGSLRQANLRILFERAKQYENASFKGLFNFINFIEKIHSGSGDLGAAKLIGENEDVVRIMSIHKSKGLEFPIIFLSNTGKTFNLMDLKQTILVHNEIGLGVKYINYDTQIEYDTLTKSAIANKLYLETISEEMRILYVALTRAKEKLIITGRISNSEEYLKKMQEITEIYSKEEGKINPILIKKYKKYLDWIMLVYKYNKEILKNICELNIIKKTQIKIQKQQQKNNINKIIEQLEEHVVNNAEYKKIEQVLEYKYPDIELSTIPTKTSVTKLKREDKEKEIENADKKLINIKRTDKLEKKQINLPKPKFLIKESYEEIEPTRRGTLIHLCMQKLDSTKNYTINEIRKLIENMKQCGQITEKEAESINEKKVYNFTQTEIWQRIKNAKKVQKEKAFYINIPINRIYDKELDGTILVQGIIDLYFIDANEKLVLIDYKTDYVEEGKKNYLIEKYKVQLDLYKQALEESLHRKVDEVYIYSTYLDKTIKV